MMKWRHVLASALLAATVSTSFAAALDCEPRRVAVGSGHLGPWIDTGNWLDAGSLGPALNAPGVFLARTEIAADPMARPFRAAARTLDFERMTVDDPVDEQPRTLASVLDARLRAEAMLVLVNGRVAVDRGWHDAGSERPRLLQLAARPLLSLLGVMTQEEGRLAGERSVSRYLPALAGDAGLRRLSVQRLIEGDARFDWAAPALREWRAAAGWHGDGAAGGVRDWLAQPGRWDAPLHEQAPPDAVGGPEDDLLAWLLAEANGEPLSRLFCERIASQLHPEQPQAWLSDAAGTELAGGLVLSLRDFARVGQWLIESRLRPQRSKLPGWFLEALTAPATGTPKSSPWLHGLHPASETRYGFVRLGGRGRRVAIIGAHGSSLLVDFDRRLVVALYAASPEARSPLQLATLQRVWDRLGMAVSAGARR